MAFEVTTLDGTQSRVDEANAYQLEGPFTTFFIADGGHGKISGWSLRVASLRTDQISMIWRVVDPGVPDETEDDYDKPAHGSEFVSLRAV